MHEQHGRQAEAQPCGERLGVGVGLGLGLGLGLGWLGLGVGLGLGLGLGLGWLGLGLGLVSFCRRGRRRDKELIELTVISIVELSV